MDENIRVDFNRKVLVSDSSLKSNQAKPEFLTDLFSFKNFILLGDPGLGKTFSFKNSAKFEDAIYQTVEQFRITRGKHCKGRILYLDGLDEYRSRDANISLIYDLIDIINEIEPIKIRISCRSADWLGATDLSKFKHIFDSNYAVAILLGLSTEQQKNLLNVEGILDTDSFFKGAGKNGLTNLLANPQTLIMIARIVKNGDWPKSKYQLFEKSCEQLLSEHNSNRTRAGTGQFKAAELIDTAGAICASILISNAHSISLLGQPKDTHVPSYRDISFCEDRKLLSALSRRSFTSDDVETESFTYIHRTIAEYLAAKWIAKQINENGLPVNRIKNILGFKGIPSAELRGIHSWLAIFVTQEIAHIFIESDPLGVILYSDPSVLSVSNKILLINSLEKLSIKDPWFLHSDYPNESLGAISSNELADKFIEILLNKESSYHLKILILDTLKYGKPIHRIGQKLIEFLNCDYSSIREKNSTISILSMMDNEQLDYLANIYYPKIRENNEEYYSLQINLIRVLYPIKISSQEISDFIINISYFKNDISIGELYGLEEIIKINDLSNLLDQIVQKINANKENITSDGSAYEVRRFLISLIESSLKHEVFFTPEQLWSWLKLLYKFPTLGFNPLNEESIIQWISKNTHIVDLIFNYSFTTYENPYLWHHDFNGTLGYPYSNDVLTINSLKLLAEKELSFDIAVGLYSYISNQIFNLHSNFQIEAFDIWFEFAEQNIEFKERRENLLSCSLDGWEYRNALDNIAQKQKSEERKKQSRRNIELTIDQIENGIHLNNIGFLASEYLGNLKYNSDPKDTLIEKYGEYLVSRILLGFQSVLSRTDFPTTREILNSNGKYYTWWQAILVAINEIYERDGSLNNISYDILETGYCLSKIFAVFQTLENGNKSQITLNWVYEYRKKHNNNYRKLLVNLIEFEIIFKIQYRDYISDLKYAEETESWRAEEAFKFLSKYQNADKDSLLELLYLNINNKTYFKDLLFIANEALNKKGFLIAEKRTIWLTTAFLLSPLSFGDKFFNYCKSRKDTIWIVRELVDCFLRDKNITGNYLSELQLEILILCYGINFDNRDYPRTGWTGSNNIWDASNFIKGMINNLSAIPSNESTIALEKISVNKNVSTYRNHVLNSLANQKRSYAENNYHQPDWNETLSILSNKLPTNNEDLLALIIDHLITIQKEFIGSNTDLYKRFWIHGKKGIMQEPDIEDLCRDRLIEILRPRLSAFALSTEREADMANHKRADIIILNNVLKLPIEIKRDTHSNVWNAIDSQLKRRYVIDPDANGYGIFLVFWFGSSRKGTVPKPPKGISIPETAADMEISLRSLIKDEDKGNLEVIVLDCSIPS